MLTLSFHDLPQAYQSGLALAQDDLHFTVSEHGLPVYVGVSDALQVTFDGEKATIRCREKAHFFRALVLLVDELRVNKRFSLLEEPSFDSLGAMIDVSRNAVLQPCTVQWILRKMAYMGMNTALLYMEDTFEMEGYPYFGYMRGRYTADEIREMDDLADTFGIELVPCIQTLGHLFNVLKWDCMADLRDTANVLLCEDERVYAFIEDMIRAASAPVRSRRIHIGMDEAVDMGLGNYLNKNGYTNSFTLISRHLNRVVDIASGLGLSPMIWSDMFFRSASKTRDYYDLQGCVPAEIIEKTPRAVDLVYWDYYHDDAAFYDEYIRRHRAFSNKLLFAGGLWTWTSPAIHYGKAFRTGIPALLQCRKHGVREVLATMWFDDGGECSAMTGLLGLQLYAEMGFGSKFSMDTLKRRFRACTGESADAFLAISLLDAPYAETAGQADSLPAEESGHISRLLLYADPLLNLFEKDFEGLDFRAHYAKMAEIYVQYALESTSLGPLFRFYSVLSAFLGNKVEIMAQIRSAYDQRDRSLLSALESQGLVALCAELESMRAIWRNLWYQYNKPQGFEVLDIRLGGLAARLETARARILALLEGTCDRIEELEESRLPFAGMRNKDGLLKFGGVYAWQRMISTSTI